MRSAFIVFLICALGACVTGQPTASPRRQSRPLGADTATQKAAFDLIQIACAAEQAHRVKSPRSPPSRFLWYSIVFPGGPDDIRIMFPPDEPPHKHP